LASFALQYSKRTAARCDLFILVQEQTMPEAYFWYWPSGRKVVCVRRPPHWRSPSTTDTMKVPPTTPANPVFFGRAHTHKLARANEHTKRATRSHNTTRQCCLIDKGKPNGPPWWPLTTLGPERVELCTIFCRAWFVLFVRSCRCTAQHSTIHAGWNYCTVANANARRLGRFFSIGFSSSASALIITLQH
jgi:hypothetical protein